MKIAKRIAVGALVLIVVLVAVAFLLPRHAEVSRTIEIAAPPATVFAVVGDLRRFNEWSPWAERDPAAVYTFTGPIDGPGQTMNWSSKQADVGSGSMRIERLDADKAVVMTVDFGSQGTAVAGIALAPAGSGTAVTWSFDSDLGFNPVARYFGLMMDGMIGPDYEKGLTRLKAVAETVRPAL